MKTFENQQQQKSCTRAGIFMNNNQNPVQELEFLSTMIKILCRSWDFYQQ